MKLPALIPLIVFAMPCAAQQMVHQDGGMLGDKRGFIEIYGGAMLSSAQLNNKFLQELINADTLTYAAIAAQSAKLEGKNNRVGADYEVGFRFAYRLGTSNHALLVKATDGLHFDATFPKTAFTLTFTGNRDFSGDTVSLNPLDLMYLRYQQLGIGWSYARDDFGSVFAMISYLNGEQLAQARLGNSWIYTSERGDTLTMAASGKAAFSDTARTGFAAPNGWGAAVDLGFSKIIQGRSKWLINAEVRNLGKLVWTEKTIEVGVDTVVEFTGLQLGDLYSLKERINESILTDSAQQARDATVSRGSIATWVPGWLSIQMMQQREDPGFEVGAVAIARWNASYTPYVSAITGWRIHRSFAAYVEWAYGGYGREQVALRMAVQSEHVQALLRLGNLDALAMSANRGGLMANIDLKYLF